MCKEHAWCVYHSHGEGYELLPLSHSSWHVLITHHFDEHETGQGGWGETGVVHGCVWHLLTQVAGTWFLHSTKAVLFSHTEVLHTQCMDGSPHSVPITNTYIHIGQPKQLRQLFLQKYSKVRPLIKTHINFKLYFQTFSQHKIFKFFTSTPFHPNVSLPRGGDRAQ